MCVCVCVCVHPKLQSTFCLGIGCVSEGGEEGGCLQSVEGVHSLLLQSGPTHCPDVHNPGADESPVPSSCHIAFQPHAYLGTGRRQIYHFMFSKLFLILYIWDILVRKYYHSNVYVCIMSLFQLPFDHN